MLLLLSFLSLNSIVSLCVISIEKKASEGGLRSSRCALAHFCSHRLLVPQVTLALALAVTVTGTVTVTAAATLQV